MKEYYANVIHNLKTETLTLPVNDYNEKIRILIIIIVNDIYSNLTSSSCWHGLHYRFNNISFITWWKVESSICCPLLFGQIVGVKLDKSKFTDNIWYLWPKCRTTMCSLKVVFLYDYYRKKEINQRRHQNLLVFLKMNRARMISTQSKGRQIFRILKNLWKSQVN